MFAKPVSRPITSSWSITRLKRTVAEQRRGAVRALIGRKDPSMTATTIRRTRSLLTVIAATVVSFVIATDTTSALPLPVGITTSDGNTIITAQAIVKPATEDITCRPAACVVPVGTLSDGLMNVLHLAPAGPQQIGFVAFIDGHMLVVDRVSATKTSTSHRHGIPRGAGFTQP